MKITQPFCTKEIDERKCTEPVVSYVGPTLDVAFISSATYFCGFHRIRFISVFLCPVIYAGPCKPYTRYVDEQLSNPLYLMHENCVFIFKKQNVILIL